MSNTTREDILRRIKALLAKTEEGSNASPEEIAAAYRKVQELTNKYNIELAEVYASGNTEDVFSFDQVMVSQTPGRHWKMLLTWRVTVMAAVARIHQCRMMVAGAEFILLGRPAELEIAQQMYYSVVNQMDVLATKTVQRLVKEGKLNAWVAGRFNTTTYRNTWLRGAADAIAQRLIEQYKAEQAASTTALVLATDEKLKEWQQFMYPHMRTQVLPGANTLSEAYGDGSRDSRNINPHAGIRGGHKELK